MRLITGRGSAGCCCCRFLVLSLIVPPALGAYSAERDSGALRSGAEPNGELPKLPATAEPVTMTFKEYASRAVFEKGKSLTANRVRLVGFVSPRKKGGAGASWYPHPDGDVMLRC